MSTNKISIKHIELTYSEGDQTEVGRFLGLRYPSWDQANAAISLLARYAPEGGAYNKTDFTLTWEDGEEYRGTIDVTQVMTHLSGRLTAHVVHFNEFYAGRYCPPHLSEEQYRQFLAQTSVEDQQAHAHLLDRYDLGVA